MILNITTSRVLDKFTPEERKNIGIHTCPGGDCDSVHSLDVDYHELLPMLFQYVSPASLFYFDELIERVKRMNAGYFLIQLASEKNKEKVYQEIGETIRKDAEGVKQVYYFCD
jgi:hypothetical protein